MIEARQMVQAPDAATSLLHTSQHGEHDNNAYARADMFTGATLMRGAR